MIDWQGKVVAPLISKFGQPAQLTRDGKTYMLAGVFDEAYSEVTVADGMPVTTVAPCFGFDLADLPAVPRQKDRLLVQAALGAPLTDTQYIVKQVRIDGHGWCRLLLNLAPTSADAVVTTAQDI